MGKSCTVQGSVSKKAEEEDRVWLVHSFDRRHTVRSIARATALAIGGWNVCIVREEIVGQIGTDLRCDRALHTACLLPSGRITGTLSTTFLVECLIR